MASPSTDSVRRKSFAPSSRAGEPALGASSSRGVAIIARVARRRSIAATLTTTSRVGSASRVGVSRARRSIERRSNRSTANRARRSRAPGVRARVRRSASSTSRAVAAPHSATTARGRPRERSRARSVVTRVPSLISNARIRVFLVTCSLVSLDSSPLARRKTRSPRATGDEILPHAPARLGALSRPRRPHTTAQRRRP